jgi:hypothetical protein
LEVDRLQRKISSLDSRIDSLEIDLKELLKQFASNEERYDALSAISEAFTRIQATIQSSPPSASVATASASGRSSSSSLAMVSSSLSSPAPGGSGRITFANVVHAFVKLMSRYPKEMLLLGLIDIIPLLSEPLLITALDTWNVSSDPMTLIDLYIQWTSTLSVFEISESPPHSRAAAGASSGGSVINWNEIKAQKGFQEMEPKAVVQTAYEELNRLIEKHSLPKLRRYLLNEWNVKAVEEVKQITQLINGLQVLSLLLTVLLSPPPLVSLLSSSICSPRPPRSLLSPLLSKGNLPTRDIQRTH